MKYMTPDLLARFRSEDDAVAEAAAQIWETNCVAYNEHLDRIRPELPRGVRGLLRRYCLHDAKVLTMTVDEASYFSIFLELPALSKKDARPRDAWLELRYSLAAAPQMKLHKSLPGDGKPLQWWLYDEFDRVGDDVRTFTHCILLTGGYELVLPFHNLVCRPIRQIIIPGVSIAPEEAGGLLALTG
jgi:hypothetical protein